MRWKLAVAVALDVVFLVFKISEYTSVVEAGIGMDRGAFYIRNIDVAVILAVSGTSPIDPVNEILWKAEHFSSWDKKGLRRWITV
ncbi:hypothetical protein WOC76_21470 [Methylocystis sp. IM3]|uniref:hypothetical protein n=1 Tax=Methylocystis sp. IM3 TaxID=3136722 RepID=UPI00311A2D43